MSDYLVAYVEGNETLYFRCRAVDVHHAREQAMDAYPSAVVARVLRSDEVVREALNAAEGFILGFEDDEMQDGLPTEILTKISLARTMLR